MSEEAVAAADRRARQQRLLRVPIIPVVLFLLVAPFALFLFTSSDLQQLQLPGIRIEYDRRDAPTSAPTPPPERTSPPQPPSPVPGADSDEAQPLPPPRQLTDPPYSLGPAVQDYDARRAKWLRDNPRLPAFVAPGRPRVLVVTGSSPRRCGNADGDHVLLRAFKNKADYCRVHGFGIFYSNAVLDAELSGFWTKLPALHALMLAHPENECNVPPPRGRARLRLTVI